MSAEKILALVRSMICWSACRTLSRIRESGDRMSGAVATTLETKDKKLISDKEVFDPVMFVLVCSDKV